MEMPGRHSSAFSKQTINGMERNTKERGAAADDAVDRGAEGNKDRFCVDLLSKDL